MIRRFTLALGFAAISAATLLAAGPSTTGAANICSHVPAAVLAAACKYLGFCCS
jgi:hypothetical protein